MPLGTLAVRGYLARTQRDVPSDANVARVSSKVPTQWPVNRYGAVLFIEKEADEVRARRGQVS